MRPPSPLAKGVLTVMLFVPGILEPRLNGRLARAHWTSIKEWTDRWHRNVRLAWLDAGRPETDGPSVFLFTAYVGRRFDANEGLEAALKPTRDEVVRLVIDHVTDSKIRAKDGPGSGHAFAYEQYLRPKSERGVLIQITPLDVIDTLHLGRTP